MTMQSLGVKLVGGSLVILGAFILFSALPDANNASEAGVFANLSTDVVCDRDCDNDDENFDDVIERSFNVSPGGVLDLSTDRGGIKIKSGTTEEVRVKVIRDGRTSEMTERFQVEFDQRGDHIRVRGETDKSNRNWLGQVRAPDVRFEIEVPEEFDLDLRTAGGGITLADHIGEINLRTAGGSLNMGSIDGTVSGQTAGGSIRLNRIDGEASLKTAGGSITLEELLGEAEIETAGGSINLGSVRGTINARTAGGSISADVIHELTNDSSLETAGGGMRVKVGPALHAVLDARTSVGKIRSNLGFDVSEDWTNASMEGTLGEGGPNLRLRSTAGSIEINRTKTEG